MITFYLLGALALALAVISCLPESAAAYTSLPMTLLWGAMAVAAIIYMWRRRLWRRPAVCLLHGAFVVILAGALLTHIWGSSQKVVLHPGVPADVCGMKMELLSFDIINYPGTATPMDFASRLLVDGDTARVSMNQVLNRGGCRIFQSGYQADGEATVLTVTKDRAGMAVSYTGYGLLMLAMLLISLPKGLRRRLGIASLMMMSATAGAWAAPVIPEPLAHKIGNLYIDHGGRIMPLSTLARDFSLKVGGSASPQGKTSEQFLTAWIFYYDYWKNEPCIRVKNSADRRLLGVDGKYTSLSQFSSPSGQYLPSAPGHEALNEQFALISAAAAGSMWRIFPVKTDDQVRWCSPLDDPDVEVEKWQFVRYSLNYLAELVAHGEWDEAEAVVDKLALYQQREGGESVPSAFRTRCERLYMSLSGHIWPAIVLLIAALLCMILSRSRWAVAFSVAGALWVGLLIALCWGASGRAPMSNGYETMQWLALASLLLGVGASRRYPLLAPLGAIVGALSLIVAFMGHATPQLTSLVPVLRSPLLSVHVLAVMVAYALLALIAVCGVGVLCGRKELIYPARQMLRPAVFFLAAGIFIGAVWANQSWGRYWGWDPKETWALITMIVYSFPLHTASLPRFRSDRFYAAYTALAFLSVMMTYFGVNFILGGMHSYA